MKITKRYFIKETIDDNGKSHLRGICHGFKPIELLVLLELTQLEIIEQMRGNIKPDIIDRKVIKE